MMWWDRRGINAAANKKIGETMEKYHGHLYDFRAIFLPYCFKIENGEITLVLNRNYKPLGYDKLKWVEYKDCKTESQMKPHRLIMDKINKWHQASGYYYLYDDGTNPVRSKSNMREYLEKLEILSKIKAKTRSRETEARGNYG